MPAIARANIDRSGTNTFNGIITSGSPTVFLDGQPVARVGDQIAPYFPSPIPEQITQGSSTIFADGIPVARLDDKDSLGGGVISASEDAFGDSPQKNTNFVNPNGVKTELLNNQKQPVNFKLGS